MSFYCQRDIEGESICDEQCEHCKEYYAPIEKLKNMTPQEIKKLKEKKAKIVKEKQTVKK